MSDFEDRIRQFVLQDQRRRSSEIADAKQRADQKEMLQKLEAEKRKLMQEATTVIRTTLETIKTSVDQVGRTGIMGGPSALSMEVKNESFTEFSYEVSLSVNDATVTAFALSKRKYTGNSHPLVYRDKLQTVTLEDADILCNEILEHFSRRLTQQEAPVLAFDTYLKHSYSESSGSMHSTTYSYGSGLYNLSSRVVLVKMLQIQYRKVKLFGGYTIVPRTYSDFEIRPNDLFKISIPGFFRRIDSAKVDITVIYDGIQYEITDVNADVGDSGISTHRLTFDPFRTSAPRLSR